MDGNNKENKSLDGKNNTGNNKTFQYKKKSNCAAADTIKPKLMMEMKFHMHDTKQRKTSDSFERIKEKIVSEIKREFDKSNHVVTSIETGVIRNFSGTRG